MTIHPPTVHFPLALLIVGSVLELWTMYRPNPTYSSASRVMLRLGWWSALLAIATGIGVAALNIARVQRDLGWINAHAITGLVIVGVYWRLVLGRPQAAPIRRRWLLLGLGLLLLTGWLGGELVYRRGWNEPLMP